MGSKISNLILAESTNKNTSGEASDFDDTMSFENFSIPDDLLIDILSYVSPKDLIINCSLVCKEWKSIIDGHSVWKLKCKREKKNIPSITFQKIPKHYYEKIYMHDPYGRNLIRNPCGEDGLAKWTVKANCRDGFAIENPPGGADPVPQEVGSQSCFATSYYPCLKYQIIDLLADGVSEEVLQAETTKIIVGEWFAARFDCASEYRLHVALFDENFHEEAVALQDENFHEEAVAIQNENFREAVFQDCKVDKFRYHYREDQWIGKEWHLVTHTFENVGRARFVYFQHFGKDCQFWAGHYGSKMTGAFVKVVA